MNLSIVDIFRPHQNGRPHKRTFMTTPTLDNDDDDGSDDGDDDEDDIGHDDDDDEDNDDDGDDENDGSMLSWPVGTAIENPFKIQTKNDRVKSRLIRQVCCRF